MQNFQNSVTEWNALFHEAAVTLETLDVISLGIFCFIWTNHYNA